MATIEERLAKLEKTVEELLDYMIEQKEREKEEMESVIVHSDNEEECMQKSSGCVIS